MRRAPVRGRGYTLLEMVLVVSIIGFAAALSLPSAAPANEERLDLAASRVAAALTFARDEAQRTEAIVRVSLTGAGRVAVDHIAAGPPPSVTAPARNPLSRQIYDFDLASEPLTRPVAFTSIAFGFTGAATQQTVYFDARGLPHHRAAGGGIHALTGGTVVIGLGARSRTLIVEPFTSRVIVQ